MAGYSRSGQTRFVCAAEQHRRCDILVETTRTEIPKLRRSGIIGISARRCRPSGAWGLFGFRFYKDAAPMALTANPTKAALFSSHSPLLPDSCWNTAAWPRSSSPTARLTREKFPVVPAATCTRWGETPSSPLSSAARRAARVSKRSGFDGVSPHREGSRFHTSLLRGILIEGHLAVR